MKVNEWFANGKNYQEGILLYSSLSSAKPNLLRLFFKKQSKSNEEKLAYELSKYKTATASELVTTEETNTDISVDDAFVPVKHQSKTQFFYRLNELHHSLHKKAMHQRNLFQKAISLKLQLNDLHEAEEVKALKMCVEIENIFDEIDAIQKQLKHYVDHKVVLEEVISDFSNLSPAKLLQRRNTKRATLSRQKKRVEKLTSDLGQNLSKAQKTKSEVALEKAEAKVLLLEDDIIQLNKLIDKK